MPILGKSGKKTEEERQESVDGDQGAGAPSEQDGASANTSMEDQASKGEQGEDGGRPSFRPDFLDENGPGQATATAAPLSSRVKGDVIFVSVAKEGGAEVHRFDDATEAQTFVEQLLEEGVAPEEVTAHSGFKLEFKVRHRPVVRLVSE
jgi:hypothetical protein